MGPKHFYIHVYMGVKHLPSFSSIGPMTTAADFPLAHELAAGPLSEVLDLI